jgi:hypothetical protein
MKLEAIGAVLVRFSAVAFGVKGLVGLVNLTIVYLQNRHAAVANPTVHQQLAQIVKVSTWSIFLAFASAVVCWLLSKPVGRLLSQDLDRKPTQSEITPRA